MAADIAKAGEVFALAFDNAQDGDIFAVSMAYDNLYSVSGQVLESEEVVRIGKNYVKINPMNNSRNAM